MKFTKNQIDELIQYLQGSCETLDDGIRAVLGDEYSEDDLTDEDRQTIDGELFLCAVCGWWYEVCEMSEDEDEQICNDCNDE